MDSIQNIMNGRMPSEPPEIKLIKQYALDEFQTNVEVVVRDKDILISVSSAALANTLRLRSPKIRDLIKGDKRLIFQIN
jgi:flagellar basal body-associated protein FliL